MQIMKKALITALLLFSSAVAPLSAQIARIAPSRGTEPSRSGIRPYVSVDEAIANRGGATRYITPLKEWQRDEKDGGTIFSTDFIYPLSWLNRQLLLRIDAASAGYRILINDKDAGYASNGAVPTEFNITKYSEQGINRLSVILNAPQASEPLLKTGVAWLGTVEVISQPTIRLRDIVYSVRSNDSGDGIAEIGLVIKTDALNPKKSRISYELLAADTARLAYGYKDITLDMRGEDTVKFATVVPKENLWSAANPVMLTLVVRNRIEGKYVETAALPIGLREETYSAGKLAVNGRQVALNVTAIAPNATAADLAELKTRGFNCVTVEAGESATALYSACDKAGMYVIPQLAVDTSDGGDSIKRGGNPSNDPIYTDEYVDRAVAMFLATRNHPSVIAYSLGKGHTNGINPYEAYLTLKNLGHDRPIIYVGAGKEWNNDKLDIRLPSRTR